MIKNLSILALLGALIFPTSCATIVSKSNYPVSINSTPSGANIVITNKKGEEIFSGQTPARLELKSGDGYFGKAHYLVKFTKDGYVTKTVPINSEFDAWYIGNIVFGGLIGFLIVDPITGAMYKIDNQIINTTLEKQSAGSANINKGQLNVYAINDIPKEWKKHLIRIN